MLYIFSLAYDYFHASGYAVTVNNNEAVVSGISGRRQSRDQNTVILLLNPLVS
jgi:hypothetical protein